MADSNKITEELLESIKIISKKQIEQISFDTTIEATIIDASKSSEGIYIVSNGNSNFYAYTTETGYKENDAVMVTVPQGDYNKQKIIIGKQINNANSPMIYKSPFQQLINVSNNLISGEHEYSFWANSAEDFNWESDISNFEQSKAYQESYLGLGDNNEQVIPKEKIALIWDSINESVQLRENRYTRIGLRAEFSTWLSEYDTAYGNYGLAMVLTFINSDSSGGFKQIITFDSKDFFGDVYNFETYFTQEAVFDISEFVDYSIYRIQLYAYQRNNFRNIYNEKIYESEQVDNVSISTIQPNIFIKNPYICLGMPTDNFNADFAEITTPSISTYYKDLTNSTIEERKINNEKILNLRWIHKDAETEIIKAISQDEFPPDYHVNWYRYKLGAHSPDDLMGAHWERFYGCKSTPNDKEEYCLTKEEVEASEDNSADIATDIIENLIFQPNVNKDKEFLCAVIFKREEGYDLTNNTGNNDINRLIAKSDIIEFTNDTVVRNEASLIDANALSIKFNDEERGNYLIYNRAGKISKSEQATTLRTVTAVFDENEHDVYKKPDLESPYTSIKWYIPYGSNSMIIPCTSGNIETAIRVTDVNVNLPTYIEYNEDYYIYTYTSNSQIDPIITVGYNIKENLNHNATHNTIRLEVNKDGQLYTAEVKTIFGTAGTSGSDYTLIIKWDNNDNSIHCNSDGFVRGPSGEIVLLDSSQEEVDIGESQYKIEWESIKCDEVEEFDPQTEKRDILYPIQNNILQTLINSSGNFDVDYFANLTDVNRHLSSSLSNAEIFMYDMSISQFKPYTNGYDANKLLYTKNVTKDTQTNQLINRKKIDFRACKEVITTPDNNHPEGSIIDGIYCYSNTKKAFIKHNDIFIIDPWDEYSTTETYYEPIYISEKNFNDSNSTLTIVVDSQQQNKFEISNKNGSRYIIPSMNDLYILKVTLTNFGDYDLVAIFPIPIKNVGRSNDEGNNQIYIVEGADVPTDVRYTTFGETDFAKDPFGIRFKTLVNQNMLTYQFFSQGQFSREINQINNALIGHWKLIYKDDYLNQSSPFLPELIETYQFDKKIIPYIQKKMLQTTYRLTINNSVYTYSYWEYMLLALVYLIGENETWRENKINDLKIKNIEFFNNLESFETIKNKVNIQNQLSILQTHFNCVENAILTRLQNFSIKDLQSFINLIISKKYSSELPQYFIPILAPSGVYFKDTPLYGVQFILDISLPNISKGTVLWTQPIYQYQDNYPSTTLNKWNGKDIVTDNDTGIISANGFSAGKKESDNTFTGVILGDWQKDISDAAITKQTGIFGFNHGTMSYALKDDGTAFFGKDGKGRIYFNGNNAQIYSANWVLPAGSSQTGIFSQKRKGMMIDVDDGSIEIRGEAGHGKIDIQGDNGNQTLIKPGYLSISMKLNNRTKNLLMINTDNDFYLQSADYNATSGSEKGVRFNLKNGELIGYTFMIQAGSGTNKLIINSDSSKKPLTIGSHFNVTWDGTITSSKGTIGGWTIGADRLTSGNIGIIHNVPSSDNDLNQGKSIFFAGIKNNGYYTFQVNNSGELRASDAIINGEIIATNLTAIESGIIGGWKINSNALTSTSNPDVFLSTSNGIKLTNNFYVTTNGTLYASSGSIGGWQIGENSLYKGNVYFNSETGTISGSTIYGGTISGNIAAGNGTITGGTISGGTISGSAIQVPGNNPKFEVDTSGNVTMQGNLTIGTQSSNHDSFYVSSSGLVDATTIWSDDIKIKGIFETCRASVSRVFRSLLQSYNMYSYDWGDMSGEMCINPLYIGIDANTLGVTQEDNYSRGWYILYAKQTTGSSQRFKRNISSITNSNLLYQLKPKSFQYNEKFNETDNNIHYGFIAEEVYKIMPELVAMDINDPTQPYGLYYNSILTLAVNEIQKLRKELNEIKLQLTR